MSMSKVTPIGRASFPNLSKPDQYNKYSVSILFPKSDPKVMELARWLKEAVTSEAMAVAGQAGLATAMSLFSNFKDGDNVGAFKTYRGEYANHFILNVSRKTEYGKPCVVNRNKQPIDPSEVYAGCNVLAYIDVFGYKFGAKKSVSVGFRSLLSMVSIHLMNFFCCLPLNFAAWCATLLAIYLSHTTIFPFFSCFSKKGIASYLSRA